jgi:hypothetical protein
VDPRDASAADFDDAILEDDVGAPAAGADDADEDDDRATQEHPGEE